MPHSFHPPFVEERAKTQPQPACFFPATFFLHAMEAPPFSHSIAFWGEDHRLHVESCRVVVVAPKPSFHSIMRRLRSPLYNSEFRLIGDTLTNPNATFGIPRKAIASLAVIPAFPISK